MKNRNTLLIIGGIILASVLVCGVCFVLAVAGGFLAEESSPRVAKATVVRATLEAIETLDFDDIVRSSENVGWTDVQFDEYETSIKGSRAEDWQGNVVDVKESLLGDYYIEVDMPGTEDKVDVFLYTNKDLAVSLAKGQQITFTGVIDGLYPSIVGSYKVEVRDTVIK
jgi:hypothetical protein